MRCCTGLWLHSRKWLGAAGSQASCLPSAGSPPSQAKLLMNNNIKLPPPRLVPSRLVNSCLTTKQLFVCRSRVEYSPVFTIIIIFMRSPQPIPVGPTIPSPVRCERQPSAAACSGRLRQSVFITIMVITLIVRSRATLYSSFAAAADIQSHIASLPACHGAANALTGRARPPTESRMRRATPTTNDLTFNRPP